MRLLAVLVAALVAVAAASAADIARATKTASYSLTLVVGPNETMYTQAEATKMHLKSGEVMVGGAMSMGHSMTAMRGDVKRHLEVQVKKRSTGAVVTNLTPQMTLTNTSGMAMSAQKLEVMAMQGIGKGTADYHFGNNVWLHPGDTYKVNVLVRGEKGVFTFKMS